MKNNIIKILVGFVFIGTLNINCTSDLDPDPLIELSLDELLARDPQAVEGILSRLYGSFALSSAEGPDKSDISDNAGESPFLRGIVNLQDFAADGMKNRWGDNGLDQLTTTSNWTPENKFFRYLYNRIFFTIPQCNNLLSILPNVDVENKEVITSEVRFIRALAYYYLIDVFGKGVLATEENYGQSEPLDEVSRDVLFDYVEAELLDIEPLLLDTNTYGRATKSAAQMLLSKLYLNAEVYTGNAKYTEAAVYINKVINEGPYELATDYVSLFSADNNSSKEIIFPLIADSQVSQSYGNTTYIINGNLSADTMPLAEFGAAEGWTGHRATKAWYGLYGDLATSNDDRAKLFWTEGHNYDMEDYKEWTDGYPSIKFRNTNFNSASVATSFSSTDFPLFRLADAYLMYAECALRGAANTDMGSALKYVNDVRKRSHANTIGQTDLTLDFIIDERGRELNLEGHRRTDLIRFGMFTGSTYIWPWKGGVKNGTSIPSTYNVYPIPSSALQANPNLTQNKGY
ncbi:RagB/SusD family nutrient uptake outer membrane protein [Aestuariibaculum sediminum]|uniref:RagB/SusD family nutrient uptake outer membrane protein n=1 Tax=Aestuariibaculum sediminum TaxID=2770637 RepID=A0A8J6U9N3_9FLAO|nr:RagB/SusD family nutrient uptake outer membrane protein [Aestuariibaculum sediminum]MBD0833417.1 RagB/SusD family nutrient uptake outer membrane protein [Aestuariibaculum sediminum]